MVRIKKRARVEEFVESKIAKGVRKAGATAEEAAQVAKEVAQKIARRAEVSAEELSDVVVASLKKINKSAADEFVRFRNKKLCARACVKKKGGKRK